MTILRDVLENRAVEMALAWALCSGAQGRSSRVAFADTGQSEAPPATSVLVINDAEKSHGHAKKSALLTKPGKLFTVSWRSPRMALPGILHSAVLRHCASLPCREPACLALIDRIMSTRKRGCAHLRPHTSDVQPSFVLRQASPQTPFPISISR